MRVALYATIAESPALAAYWRFYRETDGSDSKIAARFGLYRKTIAKYHRAIFRKRFKANYLAVRMIRGKAA